MSSMKIKYQSSKIRSPVVDSIKGLSKWIGKISGRNNTGKLVLLHRGGGTKKIYRIIDYKRVLWNLSGVILYNEYDPNRTSLISLLCFYNGILSYIIATEGITSGDILFSGVRYIYSTLGNNVPLSRITEGSQFHSLELYMKKGSQFVRSAGTFAVLVKNFFKFKKILVRLPSKEEILVNDNFFGVIGQISKPQNKLEVIHKAGVKRLKGFRPHVRGVAMNPTDHPHGGGGGKPHLTFWAKVAKGKATRTRYKIFNYFIILRSRKKRKKWK